MFDIQNRRYIGSKYKIMPQIKQLIEEHCEGEIFFDVFAGTGIVTALMSKNYKTLNINDFLFSNEIIYNAFFAKEFYDKEKISQIAVTYAEMSADILEDNYVSINFGGKFFSVEDAKIIGFIREDLESKLNEGHLNKKEYNILLASLLYSADKVANTVGHYDAYRKKTSLKKRIQYTLIKPINLKDDQNVNIFREDANALIKNVKADIAFIDPPYNSRQYSRFYHVLENIAQWKKPELTGTALKPEPENISDYCKVKAPIAFKDLISNLNCNYAVVTYNNTYNPKSSSSKNKITKDEIESILKSRGSLKIFEIDHKYFNTGKTDFKDHKEYVYILKVGGENNVNTK